MELFGNYLDYIDNTNKIKNRIKFFKFKRNDMFIKQTKNFLNSINKKEKLMTNIEEGIKTLKLSLLLKKWN